MEKRDAKIQFPRMGNGTGARINLSIPLLKKIGFDKENRDVEVIYNEVEKTIIIQKKK
ncbi:MAG: hypothetical protein ACK5NU_10095 [Fusobacterium ulcerans]|uniref:hypothetical protein n=1 Tax=Fusobacterium ulcerans TaxID=861 RepID=UPI003A861E2A